MVVLGLTIGALPSVALVIGGALLAFVVTALVMPLACKLAINKGWVDRPDADRKRHERPTPTVGGIVVVLGFAAGLAFLLAIQDLLPFKWNALPMPFWLGAAAIIATGIYDDVRHVSFKAKLAVQICVAYMLLHAGFVIEVSDLPFVETDVYNQALYSIPLTMVWIVGVINAVNLIDGLDGLAAGTSLIAICCLAVIFGLQGEFSLVLIGLLIGGALLGFLLFNFNPASVFLGDAGSLFLGYVLAVFSLSTKVSTDPALALIIPALVLGVPVFDTGLSVVRRVVQRKDICSPDHDHIHHRMRRYFSHRATVLILYAVSLAFGCVAVLASMVEPYVGIALICGLTIVAGLGLIALGYGRKSESMTAPAQSAPQASTFASIPLFTVAMPGSEGGDGESSPERVGSSGGDGASRVDSDTPEFEIPQRQVA